jgi:hypothetical protein
MQGPSHPFTLSPEDWEVFRREYSPYRFSHVLDRRELTFPDWFMPYARGAVIPSARVMKPISSHRARPAYWYQITPDVFRGGRGPLAPAVNRFGRFWAVVNWGQCPKALAFHCGSTPVLVESYRDAIWLWTHLMREQLTDAWGYCWVPILPSPDATLAREVAAYRQSLEIADRLFWMNYDAQHGLRSAA